MKIIAVSGSPRMEWNTNILLSNALEGAQSAGAQAEFISLYGLDFKGCISCLACKAKGSKSLGHCSARDHLSIVLERIDACDGLILGSPIYLGDVTGMMRILLERLIFQYISYDDFSSYYKGSLKTAFIYTMNAPGGSYLEEIADKYKGMLTRHFGYAGTLASTETLQVDDYQKYHMAAFNEAERRDRRERVFPDDCRKAFELGKAMAEA